MQTEIKQDSEEKQRCAEEEELEAKLTDEVADSSEKLRENTLNSYIHEWNTYFSNYSSQEELLKSLRSRAFKESLRGCFFRSICWRVSIV